MLEICVALVTAIVVVVTAIIEWDNHQKTKGSLEEYKKFVLAQTFKKYIDKNIIFLGPRSSGKTSIIKRWAQPWFNIQEEQATTIWKAYRLFVENYCLDKGDEYDQKLDIDLSYSSFIRLFFYDYPGEEKFLLNAIKELTFKENVILIFILDVVDTEKNNRYYSKVFAEILEQQANLSKSVFKVFIVFNKVDLIDTSQYLKEIDGNKSVDKNNLLEDLKNSNSTSITRIENIFGCMTDFDAVSAEDNRWLINLLGDIYKSILIEELKQRDNNDWLEKLKKDFSR